MRGSDYIGPVVVKAAQNILSPKDRILATFPVTPSGYSGTRITQLASLWERYRFRSFHVRYVPAVPNTLACQFVLYIDTDPNDDPTVITDPEQLIRQATAQAGSQQWNFNMAKKTPLAIRKDDQWYYTGIDKTNERFNRQGTAYLIQITDPINFNGEELTSDLTSGSIFIDWDCDFQIQQIEPAAAQGITRTVFTMGSNDSVTVSVPSAGFVSLEGASQTATGIPDVALVVGSVTQRVEASGSTDVTVTLTAEGAAIPVGDSLVQTSTTGVESNDVSFAVYSIGAATLKP
jgi:hypothetical protein